MSPEMLEELSRIGRKIIWRIHVFELAKDVQRVLEEIRGLDLFRKARIFRE